MLGSKKSFFTTNNIHRIPLVEQIGDGLILFNNINKTLTTLSIIFNL